MEKIMIFSRRILLLSLAVGGLFFYDSGKLNLALADSGPLIESLRNTPYNNAKNVHDPLVLCKGTSNAHTPRKVVALTFDDGPHKRYTEQVIEILKLNKIKGTFFVVGTNAKECPEIVKTAYKEGNVIGNHTYSHHHLNHLNGEDIEEELTKNGELINEIIGVYPALFRPPYGACSDKSVRVARNLGFKTIMWSAMVDDYHVDRTTAQKIASTIVNLVRPGAIIGLHDGGGNREKTVEALQIIIKVLRREGYEFVTIPELLHMPAYLQENEAIF